MSADSVTAVAAVAVAVIALFVSIADRNRARIHDRLSVRPLLRVDRCTETENGVWIGLANSGLGPAVIKQVGVGFGTRAVFPEPGGDDDAPWLAALEHRDKSLLGRFQLYLPASGDALAQGESLVLLRFPEGGKTPEARREALRFVHRGLHVAVRYESMYGEGLVVEGLPLSEGEGTAAA